MFKNTAKNIKNYFKKHQLESTHHPLLIHWSPDIGHHHHHPKKLFSKKRIASLLIVVILLSGIPFVSPKTDVVHADSLIKFDEGHSSNANDTNSTVSAGTITNALWRSENLCKFGKCLYFDGTGDYVSFADDANLDMGNGDTVTIEGWFRTPDISSGTRTLVSKYETGGSPTDGGYKITMNSSGYLVFGIDNDDTSFPSDSVTSTVAYDDNQWHHFAAVKDGSSSITLYIDAISVGTPDTSPAADVSNDDTFYIGIDNGSSNGWVGFIDEIKVLRTARTADGIKADFLAGTPSRGTAASFGERNLGEVLSDGLVGYWKMDDNVSGDAQSLTDFSGNNKTATTENNATNLDCTVGGKFNLGCDLDGTDDYVFVSNPNLPTTDFTYSIWVKLDAASDETVFMVSNSGSNEFLVYIDTSATLGGVYLGNTRVITAFASFPTANWQHIVVTRQNSTVTAYVNSASVGTGTSSTTLSFGSCPLLIGVDNDNTGCTDSLGNYLNGKVDEARVYNRAFSPAEVLSLYKFAPGPVGEWKFDENTGITSYDLSANGNNASFNRGNPFWTPGKYGTGFGTIINADIDSIRVNDPASGILDFSDSQDFTTQIWIKFAATEGSTLPLLKGVVTASDDGYSISIGSTGLPICKYSDGTIQENAQATTGVVNNLWHLLTCVMDRDGYETGTIGYHLFVDGVLVASDTSLTAGSAAAATNDLDFGERSATGEINGTFDHSKIYNYARTQEQIIEDMNAGHPAPGSPVGSAVAHWKMDEGYGTTAYDSTPNANNLTLSTASWTNSGKFGKAWNGTNANWACSGSGSCTDNDDLDFTAADDFSISFWFKSDSSGSASGIQYLLNKGSDASAGYAFNFRSAGNQIQFFIDDDSTWAPPDSGILSSTNVYDALWHHVVGVKTGTSKTELFIDGKLENSDMDISGIGSLAGSSALYIGDLDGADNGDEFPGDIDEVKIFRSALTADQIKLLYNQSSSAVWGAVSTDSSDNPSWSAGDEYCPPGQGSACTAPVAHWKLDENTGTTTNDSTGNGNTSSTFSDNATWTSGKYGSGITFDGTDDAVLIPETSSTDLGATTDSYTVQAWLKTTTDFSSSSSIVTKFTSGDSVFPIRLGLTSDERANFEFRNSVDDYCTTGGTTSLNDGKWHFITGVRNVDTDRCYIYVDGILVDNDPDNTLATTANNRDIALGNNTGLTLPFRGSIDDARIYDYARTPAQIAWDYYRGAPIAWWKLDDNVSGDNKTVYDSSGNGMNGTTNYGANTTGMDCTINGKRNLACDFDGADDHINISDNNKLSFGDSVTTDRPFTVSAWINMTDATSFNIYSKGSDSAREYSLDLDTNDLLQFVLFDNTSSVYIGQRTDDNLTADQDSWIHITATYDGSKSTSGISLYKNGRLIASSPLSAGSYGAMHNQAQGANIARKFTDGTLYANGLIDDVRIFNYALTQQQIKLVYNEGAVSFIPVTGTPQ